LIARRVPAGGPLGAKVRGPGLHEMTGYPRLSGRAAIVPSGPRETPEKSESLLARRSRRLLPAGESESRRGSRSRVYPLAGCTACRPRRPLMSGSGLAVVAGLLGDRFGAKERQDEQHLCRPRD
jgi:hypothetical protein